MRLLEGKTAIVSGGGRGTGREICVAFANEGAQLAIIDSDVSAANAVAAELESCGTQAVPIACDINNRDQLGRAVDEAADWFGTVDILVNSPGATAPDVALADMTDADFALALAGPTAAFRFMQACRPHLRAGAHIVNVTTAADVVALPNTATRDWDWYGITVDSVVVACDESMTGFHDHAGPTGPLPAVVTIPPSAVGRTAVLLAGPHSSFVQDCVEMTSSAGTFAR